MIPATAPLPSPPNPPNSISYQASPVKDNNPSRLEDEDDSTIAAVKTREINRHDSWMSTDPVGCAAIRSDSWARKEKWLQLL